MKKLLLFLAAAMLSGVTNSFAQETEKVQLLSDKEFFSQADYIIEARGAGHAYSYDINGNYNPDDIYSSLLLKVTYVYKNSETGSISVGDTLRLIRKGGIVYKETEEPLHMERVYSDKVMSSSGWWILKERLDIATGNAIYFVTKNALPETSVIKKIVTKKHIKYGWSQYVLEDSIVENYNRYVKVNFLQNVPGAAISLPQEWGGDIAGLNGLAFDNRYELYKYMEQFEGVTVPLSDPEKMWVDLKGDVEKFKKYRKERNIDWKLPSERQQKDIDSLNRFLEMKVQRARENREKKNRAQGLLKAPQANNVLTVSIQNQRVNYDNTVRKYYHNFDVSLNAF